MKKNKVIVLILSYNGKPLLEEAIESYLDNDYKHFEVVVIDNGSTDGTKEYVEKNWPGVKLLRTEVNLKYSGGFNFGLQYAFEEQNADYVLITNNDVKADSRTISALVEAAQKADNIGFVTGKVYYYDQPLVLQTVGKSADPVYWRGGHIGNKVEDHGQFDREGELAWCDDIFWLVKRELYEKTGGYDTEFQFQAEDFDWQVRAKKAGYKIFYAPKAKIWHKESMTIGKSSAFKTYYDARNPLIVHLKHRSPTEVRPIMHRQLNALFWSSAKNLVKLKWAYLSANWRGFLSALSWGLKNRKITLKHFI